ncbi:predicted protein [Lichtheimia corymbifera JMRC:FSU:9682]|uniref:Uncharacterized protein n=1 Tax=Lichtheimia corymbifera JMRC:FSU:9682 TaxID=1263082 RepID=A0A068S122_9FUNG|nr:predicted protein [Lichtheimia corymbifera JMRC:FSU:9682]
MNKDHLSYSITLTAYVKHKIACISKLYNETWGVQSNKVARRGQAHLVCKFHDRRGHSQIHPMSPPASSKKFKRSTQDPLWLAVTLRNLGSPSLIVELAPKVRSTPTSNFVL